MHCDCATSHNLKTWSDGVTGIRMVKVFSTSLHTLAWMFSWAWACSSTSTTCLWPFHMATWSADLPFYRYDRNERTHNDTTHNDTSDYPVVTNASITTCSTQLTALVWLTLAPALQRASTIGVKPFSLATVRAVAPSWIETNTTYILSQWLMNQNIRSSEWCTKKEHSYCDNPL